MATQYLIKLVQSGLTYTYVDASVDVFAFKGLFLGGVLFDETNIVTVSGTNSLGTELTAVSGAASIRDDVQDGAIATNYALLDAKINSVSGGSSLRDDGQDAVTQSVSGNLQSQINAIISDTAKEERFEATTGQVLFTLPTITFNPSASVRDIQVFKNLGKTYQSSTGLFSGGDWQKVGNNQIQFFYGLQDGDRVIVRDERTGGGGGVSGGGGGGGGGVSGGDSTAMLTLVRSDILSLATTPIQIIAAPGAGKAIIFKYCEIFYDFGTVAYANGSVLKLFYSGSSQAISNITNATTTTSTADVRSVSYQNRYGTSGQPIILGENAAVVVSADANETEVGTADSTIKVRVTYATVDVLN